jgi:predicted O-linked N-acetylglucosamine transferase (SPINDLY family)
MNGVSVADLDAHRAIAMPPEEIVAQSMRLAAKSHTDGDLAEAEKLYRAILAFMPNHADALHGMGVLAHQCKQDELSEQFLRAALAGRDDPTFHNNLALVLLARDRPHEAMSEVYRALELRAQYPAAYNALGAIQERLKLRAEAAESYGKAIDLNPDYADAHSNLAKVLFEIGRLDDSARSCDAALALKPNCPEALNLKGNILRSRGKNKEALDYFDRAIEGRPVSAEIFSNKALALKALKRSEEALATARCATACDPSCAQAIVTLGSILMDKGELAEAIEHFERAIACDPSSVEAYNNLGSALINADRTDEGIEAYEKAIELSEAIAATQKKYEMACQLYRMYSYDKAVAAFSSALEDLPNFVAAKNNLGVAMQNMGMTEEALDAYEEALAIDPRFSSAYSNKLMGMQYSNRYGNADVLALARRFGEHFDRPDPRGFPDRDLSPERRLRIGYISGDFNSHPVGFFSLPTLGNHDHAQFEVYCYYNCNTDDEITAYFRHFASHWRSVVGSSDEEVAEMIRDDEIDILVDLNGHTAKTRLTVLGLRPAPVQAHWVGFTGTTGLPSVDYLILDPVSAPPGAEQWYTESLVRLPYGRFSYVPMVQGLTRSEPPCLTRGHVTFGSFNNITKITDDVFALWADIVVATPGSRLLLKSRALCEEKVRERFIAKFEGFGVSPERVELRGASQYRAMLAEYNEMDIALDPYPFGGATTSCDALLMGVPVITLPSDRLASRQTACFYANMGVEGFVATSREDYIGRAVALAGDPERLRRERLRLPEALVTAPFADPKKFAANIERAYRIMWRRYALGEPPEAFSVEAEEVRP